MKKSSINRLSVFVCGLIISLWIAVPVLGGTPEGEPKDFTQWMKTLPEATQAQVMEVFRSNMECAENAGGYTVSSSRRLAEGIYRDLQLVLTTKQLELYNQFSKVRPTDRRLSATRATCGDCYWLHQLSLSYALNYLNTAQSNFDPITYNCVFPPWGMAGGHPINAFMIASISYLNNALDDAWAAYSTCDCASAQSALSNAQEALKFLDYAIGDTLSDCDPNTPWLSALNSAKTWLQNAISLLPDCINQACN